MKNKYSRIGICIILMSVSILFACRNLQGVEEQTLDTGAQEMILPDFDLMEVFQITNVLQGRLIKPGVVELTHSFPWPANSLLVEMRDGSLLLVDTPYTYQGTKALYDWIFQNYGDREMIAINTHFHYDNLGGNGYLLEMGVPVYGSDLTVELLNQKKTALEIQMKNWLKDPQYEPYREEYLQTELLPPDHVFPILEGLDLEIGGEVVSIIYPGPAHSEDNLVVYFPVRNLLFGGCMVIGWDSIGNTTDANMDQWPDSLAQLYQYEVDMIVPGHGDRLDTGLLDNTARILSAMR
ncbi:MAG: MBL fold metallo-hydrolase [Anaerolineales bacterium]|nr:MBL fold metallo-hydrolase [Anaerolineales bacterium]